MSGNVYRATILAVFPMIFSHNSYAELSILSGEIYDNSTPYYNYDVINNQGTLNNTSDISNSSGSLFLNYGLVNSSGNIFFNSSSSLQNNGEFNQAADFWADSGSSIVNSGSFSSAGNFTNGGALINGLTGLFANWYVMHNDGQLENNGVLTNYSNINNNQGRGITNTGELNNNFFITFQDFGFLSNSGTINNAERIELGQYNTVTNSGLINNNGHLGGRYSDNFLSGTQLINTGMINNTGNIEHFETITNSNHLSNGGFVNIHHFGRMVNESTAVINNGNGEYSQYAFYTGEIQIDGTLENAGSLNNEQAARININSFMAPGIENTGVINNQGLIEFTTLEGVVNNAGHIINDNGEIRGSYNSPIGTINNSGTVENLGNINVAEITSTGNIINNSILNAERIEITNGNLSGGGEVHTGTDMYQLGETGLIISENGTLLPGDGVGRMDVFGNIDLQGTLSMEFGYNPDMPWESHDVLGVSGHVVLGANSVLDISLLDMPYFYLGDSFDLMYANSINGEFGSFYHDALFGTGLAFEWNIINNGVQDILQLSVVSAVPVPAAAWLFISGFAGLIATGRHRKLNMIH